MPAMDTPTMIPMTFPWEGSLMFRRCLFAAGFVIGADGVDCNGGAVDSRGLISGLG